MAAVLPLILRQEPVTRGLLARMKESRPNIAVVYADAFGEIAYFQGRPLRWSEQVGTRYRVRYEVDLSDHRRTARLDSSPLPSRGDAFFFHSMVDVGFRVTDPAAVVKRNVTDGLAVVYNYLIDTFRPITREYDIGESAEAEDAINFRFQHPVELAEGITIYHCRARLLPDEAAKEYLRRLRSASRSLDVGEAEHKVGVMSARQVQEIAEIEKIGRLEAEKRELNALREPVDLGGLIRTHLSKHPGDTAYATQLLLGYEQAKLEHRGTDDQRWLDLTKYMIDNEIIQAVDVELLRKQTLDKVQQITAPAPEGIEAGAGWDKPLPVLSLAPEPSSTAGRPGPDPAALSSVIPVYLIIDESVQDESYYRALDDGLADLPAILAQQPEVLAAIRLAVVGYAGDAAELMGVNAVTAGTMLPPLSPRQGSSLSSVFTYLHGQLPRAMERLKSRYTVFRPTVYLFSATAPAPEAGWQGALDRVLDRTVFRYAPNTIACGASTVPAEALRAIGGYPGCRAYQAGPDVSPAAAAGHFAAFVQRELAAQVRAQISGRTDVVLAPPEQFGVVAGPMDWDH